MRILLATKFYYRRGGDCIYALNLEELLKAHGHEVAVFAMQYPENLPCRWEGYFPSEIRLRPSSRLLETLIRPYGLGEVRRKFRRLLDDFEPDVLHCNIIHTHISPVIVEMAKERGIRTVWTMHDYKLLCPQGLCRSARGGDRCELCLGHGAEGRRRDLRNCIRNRCVKDSVIGSYIGYWEALYWTPSRLQGVTDAFVCPSQFMAGKMRQGGFDQGRLRVLCNFMDVRKCAAVRHGRRDDYYCYVGRLSQEKGVETLVRAAGRLRHRLIVVGGGPLERRLRDMAPPNIEFAGFRQWEEVREIMMGARFIVVPSECYENNPLSAIEALCMGTPVLGARIGGIPELIEEGRTGMAFESGDAGDLERKIGLMLRTEFDYEGIASLSRLRYDAENYYHRIMNIYQR